MNPEEVRFADTELVRETLKDMYPEAKRISLVEHGYDNIVGLVDELYAVRFPRNASAYKRSQYEKAVLNSLKELQGVTIPRVLGEKINPPCMITSFVPGAHISASAVNNLPHELQEAFGRSVAEFAYRLHSTLSVEEAKKLRKELELDKLEEEPWAIYLQKTLIKTTLPTPQQDNLAKRYFDLWKQYDANDGLVVVHDDLHTENMLFENGYLVGVLDFGDTNIGTPEQELRLLYRINEVVVNAAVDSYSQLAGIRLDVEAIKTWAITQELAAYSERLMTANTKHPAFARACRNLNMWLPDGNWGAGFTLPKETSSFQ